MTRIFKSRCIVRAAAKKASLAAALLVLLVSCAASRAYAAVDDTFLFNGVNYRVTSETGVRTVEVTSRAVGYTGNITIPATVLYASKQYRVTGVGFDAFGESTELMGVSLPSGLVTIGDGAFFGCTKLGSVTIPDSVETIGDSAFYNCTNMTQIHLGTGLTTIADSAFADCSRLSSVTIPANLTNIGRNVFSGCRNLGSITVDAQNTAYRALNGILFNAAGTTLLQCPGAKSGSVTIPAGVTRIDDSAFSDCRALTGVTIPASVVEIGEEAFADCMMLGAMILPEGLRTIDTGAFAGCALISDVAIPASVTYIGTDAFYDCAALQAISVADANTGYASQDGILYNKAKTTLLCCPAGKAGAIAIPSSVTALGPNAFYHCVQMSDVFIPAGVQRIPSFAFEACTGLRSVTMCAGAFRFALAVFKDAAQNFTIYTASDPVNYTGAIPSGVTVTPILSLPAQIVEQNRAAKLMVLNRCPFPLHGLLSTTPGVMAQAAGQTISAGGTTSVRLLLDASVTLPINVTMITDEGVLLTIYVVAGAAGEEGGAMIPDTGDDAPLFTLTAVIFVTLLMLGVDLLIHRPANRFGRNCPDLPKER